jgi:hypothetical protein
MSTATLVPLGIPSVLLGMTNQTASTLSVHLMNIPHMIHMVYFTIYSLWILLNICWVYSAGIRCTYSTTYLPYIQGMFLKDTLHILKIFI